MGERSLFNRKGFIRIQEVKGSSFIHSDINHSKGCHSCESRNPEKHWIPGQARNDRLQKTYVVMYSNISLTPGTLESLNPY
jgi:hypothetical protein